MAAVVLGLVAALIVGIYSLRDRWGGEAPVSRIGLGLGSSATAAAGIIGIQLLFNQDVVLAGHYLPSHDAGIYGGLNKIATIPFYVTLGVSQVLFPRVVDAVTRKQNPSRLLVSSAAILSSLGLGALLVFAVAPGLVVTVLYGPTFRDAAPFVLAVGLIGLALSLNNMLVQFLMAVQDYWFVPILVAGCVVEAGLIIAFHSSVGQVVLDVLLSMAGLLVLLAIRCYLLLLSLRDASVAESIQILP
jgi:O-antigen/teichoic acid export membrane protein